MHRIHDAAGVKDRHPGRGVLDGGGKRHEDGRREAHVGHGRGLQRVGVGAAADDREEVDETGGGEPARDGRHVLGAEAAGSVLVTRDAGAHDEVAAGSPSDLREHLEAEAHAVVQAAAVLVAALIEERRPELIDEMVVGHRDLDAVQPALATAPRRLAER